MQRKKVGIMGGTFNPIHNGHVALARAAYAYCNLDEVWFMPSGISYLKKQDSVASGSDRFNMAELATEGIEGFYCSDLELKRAGNTYTAETLQILTSMHPTYDFYFIMGADSLMGLMKWKAPEIISKLCTLAVVVRDDVDCEELLQQEKVLQEMYGTKVVQVPFEKVDISSSEIRMLLGQYFRLKPCDADGCKMHKSETASNEKNAVYRTDTADVSCIRNIADKLHKLLPEKVLDYILEHKLYWNGIGSEQESLIEKHELSHKECDV